MGGVGIVLLELRVLCDVGRVLLVLVVFGSCFGNGDDVDGVQGVDGRSAGMLRGRRGGAGDERAMSKGWVYLWSFCAVFCLLWAPLGSTDISIRCASIIARLLTSTERFSCSMHLHMRESSYLQAHVSRIHMARI